MPQTLGPPQQFRDWEMKPKPRLVFLWNWCLEEAPQADSWWPGGHPGARQEL